MRKRMQHWLYCNSCDTTTSVNLTRIATTASTQEVLVRKRLSPRPTGMCVSKHANKSRSDPHLRYSEQ